MNDNIINCWNSIGVWGKEKPRCPVLDSVIHCQNCEKYITAGRNALQREFSSDYDNANVISKETDLENISGQTLSAMVIRIGDEWFALPSGICEQVSEDKSIHSIPHQNNKLIKGIVNIGGEVQLCFSLGTILGVKASDDKKDTNRTRLYDCLIVITFNNNRYVFPVSEFKGLYQYKENTLTSVPSTIKTNAASYLTGIIKWDDLNIGCLDPDILFNQIERDIQ